MADDFHSARFWARELVERALYDGARAVDATMGNGHDTRWLCECVGAGGRVWAFDIQQDAVTRTRQRLIDEKLIDRAELICASHAQMAEYVREPVDAIVFNLGWLPGAAHGVTTHVESTLAAVEAGLSCLKPAGLMTICVYPGHEEGARERDALLQWGRELDAGRYDVMLRAYLNQPGDPPLMLAVRRRP